MILAAYLVTGSSSRPSTRSGCCAAGVTAATASGY